MSEPSGGGSGQKAGRGTPTGTGTPTTSGLADQSKKGGTPTGTGTPTTTGSAADQIKKAATALADTKKKVTQSGEENQARRTYTLVATGAEADKFDFTAGRPTTHRTNIIQSVGHLIKSCLGGGVVSIHATYANCGLWVAVVMNFLLGILVSYLMIVLAKSAQRIYGRTHINALSYPEVAEATLQISRHPKLKRMSRLFRYLVDTTIMIDLFGSCCCYQCLIAEQASQLLSHYFDVELNIRAYIAILLLPCIAICMILSLKYLAPFSIVADFVILVVAIATVVYGIQNASKEKRSPLDMKVWRGDIPKTFQFIGGCVFSMEGVGVTLPIENNMAEPHKISLVLMLGMGIVISIVMTVGFFGYWGWAADVKAPVTKNFPMNMITLGMKIALPIMIYVTFALNFWVPFNLAWVYIKDRHPNLDPKLKERIYRAIFVTTITVITVIFPKVVVLISVLGAFCLSNMGFLYPAFIELMLDWDEPGLGVMKWRLIKFILIAVFALSIMIVGTIGGVVELIETFF